MKRFVFIFISVLLLLCAGVIGFELFRWPKNPVYQGKRLDVWLKEAQMPGQPGMAAMEALRHYGRDAEPMLKTMLEARDSKIVLRMQQLLVRQKLVKFNFQPAIALNLRALNACNILGPQASGTVPAIGDLVERSDLPVFGQAGYEYPLDTLALMGPEGLKALVSKLDNQNPNIRVRAAELLGTAPWSGTPKIIAALEKHANGTGDLRLRSAASQSLQLLKNYRDQHVPASATNLFESPEMTGILANAWDITQGVRVLRTSGLEQGQGAWCAEDLFGARRTRVISGETGSLVFDNTKPDGFTHFIEWETPEPVTLRSFGFLAGHDGADTGFQRAMRTFRLYARAAPEEQFKLIYSEELRVPYGEGEKFSMLFLFRNFETPVTARQFRAEFVQSGDGYYHGPRAIQLYGFRSGLNWPMIESALRNRAGETQVEARRFFEK